MGEHHDQFDLREINIHEIMDRCYIISELWETHVENHKEILNNTRYHKLANAITNLMADLYQELCQEIKITSEPKTHQE